MRRFSGVAFTVFITLITFNALVPQCEARGGRGGRGGGSFGGIFGGWRKYKKQASGSNSRRTTNGSPMQTTLTKSMSSGSNSGGSLSNVKQSKPQAGYPKQQMPNGGYGGYGGGYTNYANYYGNGGAGTAHLPPGSTYYPSMGAMPQGAIYYAQQPQRSGTGDFLLGMMTGHMMNNMMFPHHHHHVMYQPYPVQNGQNNHKVIVVNNGDATILNETASTQFPPPTGVHFWPTDSDTALEPFNTSVTPEEALQPGNEPIYLRGYFNNFPNTQMNQAAQQQPEQMSSATTPLPPVNGIICMPVMLNETDPNDPTKTLQVERTLCFPAPPPPSEALIAPENANCMTRTFIERDPNDPSKTIEVAKEICLTTTSTLEPPQVAGEIEEVKRATEAPAKVNEKKEEHSMNFETSTEGKFIRSLTTKSAV